MASTTEFFDTTYSDTRPLTYFRAETLYAMAVADLSANPTDPELQARRIWAQSNLIGAASRRLIRTTTETYGELTEIAVKNDNGTLIAVVTHPFPRAPWWFLHRWGSYGKEKFRTRKAALAAVGA